MTTTLNKLIENKNKEFDQLIYKELLNYGYEAFIVLVKDFLSQSIKAGYELAIKDNNEQIHNASMMIETVLGYLEMGNIKQAIHHLEVAQGILCPELQLLLKEKV